MAKKQKTFTLTGAQIEEMKKDAVNQAMTLLLAIPCAVLLTDYWPKSARKRLPGFIDRVLEVYKDWEEGRVTMEKLKDDLWEYGGVKVNEH